MALAAIITEETYDKLSGEIRKEYKKLEGQKKYQLDVIPSEGFELEEVSKLQSALSKERENARAANDRLKAYEGIDDPAKARDAIKKVQEMANWKPQQKVQEQIEAVKTQMLDAHGKEKAAYEQKLKNLNQSLEDAMIVSAAAQILNEEDTKGSVKILLPHIRQRTRLRESDNGSCIIEVIDSEGNTRLAGSDGHTMSIKELVSEMKTQSSFACAFDGSGASGTGALPAQQARSLGDMSNMTPEQKLRYARSK